MPRIMLTGINYFENESKIEMSLHCSEIKTTPYPTSRLDVMSLRIWGDLP